MIKILKMIARRILKDDLAKMKSDYEITENDHYKQYNEAVRENCEKQKELIEKESEIKELSQKNMDLQSRIEIMEKYYGLHEEPTMEEKVQIRIDLKIHDLEQANIKLNNQITSFYSSALSLVSHNIYPLYQFNPYHL